MSFSSPPVLTIAAATFTKLSMHLNDRENPELSIIVPVLDEISLLPQLLCGLNLQKNIFFEVIISDGGSGDGTVEMAGKLARQVSFPVRVVEGERGRGCQLNRGARAARGRYLLFLHVDCRFTDCNALRSCIDSLESSNGEPAGKFRLRFERSGMDHPFGYYYHECKARLIRPECTHGDQGLLLPHALFSRLGPFDETYPMLAETRMADSLVGLGLLTLLPSEVRTSARRFEKEGLRERQTLNAITLNFAAQEWRPFFEAFPLIYPRQDQAAPLPLRQILQGIARLIRTLSLRERLSLWYRTGRYVRSNAWQLAFARDCVCNFRGGIDPGAGATPLLDLYDRHVDRVTDNAVGRLLAALLVRIWFGGMARR